MSRMLQALKNLESRSAWPLASAKAISHPAEQDREPVASQQLTLTESAVEEAAATANPFNAQFSHSPTVVIETPFTEPVGSEANSTFPAPMPQAAAPESQTVAAGSQLDSADAPPLPQFKPSFHSTSHAELSANRFAPSANSARQPSLLERTVERTLRSPEQALPFRELAERIWNDCHPSAGRSALFVGVGPESITHESLVHAAAVLAENRANVLLIDADIARHILSEQLGYQTERGLTAAAMQTIEPHLLIQPTSLARLSFLPAGAGKIGDQASAAGRLAEMFGRLASEYELILLDGGRSGDKWATTLARLCDATYFVVRLGATDAGQAQAALREFRAAAARVVGCIAVS